MFLIHVIECSQNFLLQYLNNTSKEIKEYLVVVGNLLENQKKEINNISEKILCIEREINRLGTIKGSEDKFNVAINMVSQGKSKDEIKSKTGFRTEGLSNILT